MDLLDIQDQIKVLSTHVKLSCPHLASLYGIAFKEGIVEHCASPDILT